MPLAIELAVGWLGTLRAIDIAQELQRNLDLLATRSRNLPERHRSMRSVFSHSWGPDIFTSIRTNLRIVEFLQRRENDSLGAFHKDAQPLKTGRRRLFPSPVIPNGVGPAILCTRMRERIATNKRK
jgi:hypothetical protein